MIVKNTVLFVLLSLISCGNSVRKDAPTTTETPISKKAQIITGAENIAAWAPMLQTKKIGLVSNQTSIINYDIISALSESKGNWEAYRGKTIHVADYLFENKFRLKKIFAPEHGFRGTADAGELINDGKDSKTGLPIISLYGNNKKPKPEQLKDIDVMVFDIQDVGARFYTYISTLHYIMEACAEQNIPVIVFDRPNPNGAIVDGPILEKEHTSFVGMHPIPVLHGLTIGEYAKMINGEKWLKGGIQCELMVVPCLNYKRTMEYKLPVKPSPNLPNDKAINLYASLCLFEGTNVSVGRGTSKQFQIYGSPDLPPSGYRFTPAPNEGAKEPLHNGKICYGEDLSAAPNVSKLELKWVMKAYRETSDKGKFFNNFFVKLAGTKKLQSQIEAGIPESEIRRSWEPGLENFKKIRKVYEMY